MAGSRRLLGYLLLLISLAFLATAAEASVFGSILKKLPSFKQEYPEGQVIATQTVQNVAVKKVKREGKRVAVIGML
jgi:hypothetical protein